VQWCSRGATTVRNGGDAMPSCRCEGELVCHLDLVPHLELLHHGSPAQSYLTTGNGLWVREERR
jgi:hypothetical protein